MQGHLLVLRLDHVLDYVGARSVTPRVAKPLSGSVAFHHTGRVVVPAIPVEIQENLILVTVKRYSSFKFLE